jgi:hypothetical protein
MYGNVLTQKAVSDALKDSETLSNGTPVRQMHKDSPRYVGTLEALQCAVQSGQIVLGRVWGFHCSDECEPTK